VSFNSPPGVGLRSDRPDRRDHSKKSACDNASPVWRTAQVFVQSAANEWILILAAIATIYVVLGVL